MGFNGNPPPLAAHFQTTIGGIGERKMNNNTKARIRRWRKETLAATGKNPQYQPRKAKSRGEMLAKKW